MTYIFDKEKLKSVLSDFYVLTKCTISIWDADFNQIMFYPPAMSDFCKAIKSNPMGKLKCLESDKTACINAAKLKKPYTFTCHAGLVDTAVPIYYDNEVIAYMMFGQIRDLEQVYSNLNNSKVVCQKYGISEKDVEAYYNKLAILDKSQMKASANFLQMFTSHLYLSQMIKIEKNVLAFDIDSYIDRNIEKDISVKELCNQFKISKNRLYQLSHKFFNTTINNYIITKKLEKAKHYLTTTDISINEVSGKAGFSDYNYFIRIFKNRIGYTPLSYRKEFPFNLP